jgi:type IX secretion system PorP/SprF family membrane protein
MHFRRSVYTALFCAITFSGVAQDIHFSQYLETPQLINPATTGVYNGYIRGIVNYKNQWAAMGNAFNTMAASVDIPAFDYNERKAHLGVGMNFFNDKAGDAGLGLTQLNLCFAGIIPVSRASKLSMGISVGGAQHKANLSSLSWGNQYDGDGFDPLINSGEANSINSFMYADLGAGMYFETTLGKRTLDRTEHKHFGIGASYQHINRPVQKYLSMSEKLYSKLVVNMDGFFDRSGTPLSILPSGILFLQGPNTEITLGCGLRYRIRNGTKITGFINETALGVNVAYRVGDAFIPSLKFEMQNFSVGVSYDVNLSAYKAVSRMNGGVEVFLKYYIEKGALFKQKNVI